MANTEVEKYVEKALTELKEEDLLDDFVILRIILRAYNSIIVDNLVDKIVKESELYD